MKEIIIVINGENVTKMVTDEDYNRLMNGEEEYRGKRRTAYLPLSDQLDMIYKSMISNEIPKCQDFINHITEVKTKYPKL